MGIVMTTTQAELQKKIEYKMAAAQQAIITILQEVGEEAINVARDRNRPNAYKNQTGNLASSVGYLIIQDGRIISQSDFSVIQDGKEGASVGQAAAKKVAADFPTDSVLIVVAGMKYGIYVERKGYDVISQAKLKAKEAAEDLINQIFEQ